MTRNNKQRTMNSRENQILTMVTGLCSLLTGAER